MPYLYYKQKAYGGTSTVNDSEHVIADNGSGSEITSQQLFENILGDLATVEESTTASKAYEVGDYIILNSYFYKVTSAIALGGTITVGTNVVKTTVGDEFKTFEFPVRELTKAQYNALPTAQQNDGTIYLITDGDGGWEAENSAYDNTQSGLTATNVQDALDEIVADGTHPVDTTGFIVLNSGFTASNVVAVRHKSILQINFVLTRNADTGANETINIGTLTASFRPKINSGAVSATYSGIVGVDGRFYLRPFQRVPANQGESVCVIMLI